MASQFRADGYGVGVEVSIQLQADAAAALEGRSTATADIEQLGRQLEALGVVLLPVHPSVEDPRPA